jgi:thiamine biosynthesis lipoprotein
MFHQTFRSMHTRLSMVLPAADAVEGARLGREVRELLRSQESMMSRFDARGELATVNRDAARGPVPVGRALWEVVAACMRHHGLTEGAFDIAQAGRRPGHGMHLLDADPVACTLRFMEPGLQLDLGAIGKGIELDLVTQYLRGQRVGQAFLSFGESSVAVIGSHPAGDGWPVGVEHLFQPGVALHRFDLRDSAMSTSGNRDGHAHIVDPADGMPATGCRTVSVACASAADAEALSTALFVLPAEGRDRVLARYPGAHAVAFAYSGHDDDWAVERTWHHA